MIQEVLVYEKTEKIIEWVDLSEYYPRKQYFDQNEVFIIFLYRNV